MPIVQLIEIVRSVPPRDAVNLLRELPTDRLLAVLAGVGPVEVRRWLVASDRIFRATLVDALTQTQLLEVLRGQADGESTELLTDLPDDRLNAVVETMREERVATLLAALPESRRATLLDTLDPGKRLATLSRKYERDVADALARANLEVSVPTKEPDGIVLAAGLGWRIAVAARYADDGTVAVHDAEAAAYRLGANAALAVVSLRPGEAPLAYCREAREHGRSLDAVLWSESKHDGQLKRAVASLFHV